MSHSPLKIISLNIEEDRHLDRFVPFIQEQQPDVVLFQEALDKDVPYLENAFQMKGIFTSLNFLQTDTGIVQLGILTLSNLPLLKNYSTYYKGDHNNLPLIHTAQPEKMARAILVTEYIKENQKFSLVNTHFTWSAGGKPSEEQHNDLNILFKCLSEIPEFIFCGDFNAPRGAAIFDKLASKYKDNIPQEISTTIDKNFHKAGDLKLVVDGLFTTPKYQVDSIKIVNNLSDHCGIVANVVAND